MKAEFIGHGLNNKSNTVHYHLRTSFLDENYDSFIGFSAYTKKAGLDLISEELLNAKERYKNLTFYLGIADKGTSKQALEFLLEKDIRTFTYRSDSMHIFHPKIFFFSGEFEKRMIVGSSNLTKAGLTINGNIEASLLINYSKLDSSGLKLQRQYFEYFEDVLNGENKFVQLLTKELLEKLIAEDIVVDEDFTFENESSNGGGNKGKGRKKQEEEEIKKKIKQDKKGKKGEKSKFTITPHYLKTWDNMFELFKEFKKANNGNVTIPRDYPNKSLYRWYRLQKVFYADDSIDEEYELKYEHVSKLIDADFYFGDAHELLQQNIEDEWLNILSDALETPEEIDRIQVNHRYKFDGHRLGTWLVGVSQAVRRKKPSQRKIDLKRKIEEMGFDFSKTSRKPEDSAQRFLDQLLNDKNPIKVEYQKIFNSQMLPRKDKIPERLKQEISVAWELRFNEKRSWDKILRAKDKTNEWKAFRYNKTLNPKGKWITGQKDMGNFYYWVNGKRNSKRKMDLVKDKFNDRELAELKNEGFPI